MKEGDNTSPARAGAGPDAEGLGSPRGAVEHSRGTHAMGNWSRGG